MRRIRINSCLGIGLAACVFLCGCHYSERPNSFETKSENESSPSDPYAAYCHLFDGGLESISGSERIRLPAYGQLCEQTLYPVSRKAGDWVYELPETASYLAQHKVDEAAYSLFDRLSSMAGNPVYEEPTNQDEYFFWKRQETLEDGRILQESLAVNTIYGGFQYIHTENTPEGIREPGRTFRKQYAQVDLEQIRERLKRKSEQISSAFSDITGELVLLGIHAGEREELPVIAQGYSPITYQFIYLREENRGEAERGKMLESFCSWNVPALKITLRLDGLVVGVECSSFSHQIPYGDPRPLPDKDRVDALFSMAVEQEYILSETPGDTVFLLSVQLEHDHHPSADFFLLSPYLSFIYQLESKPEKVFCVWYPVPMEMESSGTSL